MISNYDNSPVQYICTLTRARRIIVFCWVGHLIFLLIIINIIITVIITIIYNSIYAIIITILYITLLYNTILLLLERCLQSSTPLPGSSSQRSSTAASLATDRLLLIAHLSPLLVVPRFVCNSTSGGICHKHHDQFLGLGSNRQGLTQKIPFRVFEWIIAQKLKK